VICEAGSSPFPTGKLISTCTAARRRAGLNKRYSLRLLLLLLLLLLLV